MQAGCLSDEAVDGSIEGSEHTALETPTRELGEEAVDGVEPGGRGRCEVESPTPMPGKPLAYLGMFVGRVVVDDGVDRLSLLLAAKTLAGIPCVKAAHRL
jgi:hypothetical protein